LTTSQGAFGNVWKALNMETGETVAVKEIPYSASPSSQKSLKKVMKGQYHHICVNNKYSLCNQEVEILKKIEHPNVLRFIDFWQHLDCLSIVLEYADGGSLYSILVCNFCCSVAHQSTVKLH